MSLLQNVERIVVPVLFSNTPAHTDGKLPPEAQIGKKRKRKTIFSKYHLNILEHGTCSFINIYEELSCVWCREGIIFFFLSFQKRHQLIKEISKIQKSIEKERFPLTNPLFWCTILVYFLFGAVYSSFTSF